MVIDCHTHLSIFPEADLYPPQDTFPASDTFPEGVDLLLKQMKKNQVEGVMVIADNVSNDSCADTNRILKYFKNVPKVWFVGSTNPFEPATRLKRFEQLVEDKKIVAMKLFAGHDKIYLNDERFIPDIEFCQRHGIPLMIHTGVNTLDEEAATYNDPKYIAEIARNYPKVNIVICHYFWPKMEYCFEQTNGLNNIFFDTSAMADPEVVALSGGWEVVKGILEKTLARRPGSVMFGTDYPMCSVAEHLRLIKELKVDEEVRAGVLGQTAARLFKLA